MVQDKLKTLDELIPVDEQPSTGSVLEDLKERVSSPFIFSYLISFICINWKIWVALLFYDIATYKDLGYKNQVEYINAETSGWSVAFWPLLSAVLYCFAYPWLRNLIKEVQAKFNTRINNKINIISGEGTVPTKKLLSLRRRYHLLIDDVSKILSEDSSQQIEALSGENINIRRQLQEYKQTADIWQHFNNLKILNGTWKISHKDQEIIFSLLDQKLSKRVGNGKQAQYYISIFHCNADKKTMAMYLDPLIQEDVNDSRSIFGLHTLAFDSLHQLAGVIKGKSEVTWTRIPDDEAILFAQHTNPTS